MAGPPRSTPTPTLRLSGWSVVRAVAMLALTLGAIAMLSASIRVVGWLLVAVILAGLLEPAVTALALRIPRGLALAVVVLVSLGLAAGVSYAVVDDLADEISELEDAVPRAAREVERSERFGEVAREVELAERAEAFVKELPVRLRGGEVPDALRSAATRGVAFLATGILTIFFLIHGPRLIRAAIRQLPDERQIPTLRIARAVYRRSWHYSTGSLAMAIISGLVAYACAAALDLPGKAPLALWVMLLDLVPLVGVVLGAVPLILLAATTATWQGTVAVAVVLLAWQAFEGLRLQRLVEDRSLHLGPFVTIAVAMVGLELYGLGGALVGLVGTVLAAATLDEVVGHGPHSSARGYRRPGEDLHPQG